MRAIISRAAHAAPGHSLSIVRLPAGMDPDDLIRENGVAAMEDPAGEQPASLLDTLVGFRKGGGALASPEDKAGLKARLLDHVDAIQHPDIRALYKRELLERFSAFAFPRVRARIQPRGDWKKPNGFAARHRPCRTEARHQAETRHRGRLARRFLRAVIAGLVRFPDQIVPP